MSSVWNGYRRLSLAGDGRAGTLVVPNAPRPGNPWIWRTEFFGAFAQADVALLGRGFHLAYLDILGLYGASAALDAMDRFYERLVADHGLARRAVLEGFSQGGLSAFNWAARHPDRVAGLYVDAPVCDLKSWPAGRGRGIGSPDDWERCRRVYDLTEEEALAYRGNPVDNLRPLAEAKIPILGVCGDADEIVPMEENIQVVERRYRDLGGEIDLIVKPGCGHHPHGLDDPAPITAFVAACFAV